MLYMFKVTYHWPKGILGRGGGGGGGGGGASKHKLKDTNFIFSMTSVTILSIFHRHAQNDDRKVLGMKSTSILNVLAILLFEN